MCRVEVVCVESIWRERTKGAPYHVCVCVYTIMLVVQLEAETTKF